MRLAIHVQIDPQMVRLVRKMGRLVSEDAGLDEIDAMAVEVAMGEALSNVFFYAYAGNPGPVAVEIVKERGALIVEVSDQGERHAPTPQVPQDLPSPSDPGRGLYLIKHLMDGLEVTHPTEYGRGTRVRMTKRISDRGTPGSFQRLAPAT
jgi:anti-sigma regulatory factor (Ser/Thr protein kinase)